MDRQKHILIIDDHEDTVSLLEDFLGDNGFQISTALTGHAGLNHIAEKRPDVIILDMVLPDMSGADICTQLRNNPATRDIPIIVCTAHQVSIEEKMQGFRAGVDDYLIRPFELAELLARINAILRRSLARPKADVLADLHTILSQPKKTDAALPPLPQAAKPKTDFTAPSTPAIKPEPPQPFEVFKRLWQILNFPGQVFEKPRYGHDFFTALLYVLVTPMIASVARISDKAAGFDGWIGAFSLGIVTNLVMWLATGGLLHLTLPFLGINLTMRRSLSVSGLAWAPRLLGAFLSAVYGLLPFLGLAINEDHFTAGFDLFFPITESPWIKALGHVGIFDLWCAWITLVAVWAIVRAEKKWTPVPILIGLTCLLFGAFTHY